MLPSWQHKLWKYIVPESTYDTPKSTEILSVKIFDEKDIPSSVVNTCEHTSVNRCRKHSTTPLLKSANAKDQIWSGYCAIVYFVKLPNIVSTYALQHRSIKHAIPSRIQSSSRQGVFVSKSTTTQSSRFLYHATNTVLNIFVLHWLTENTKIFYVNEYNQINLMNQ